MKNLSLAVGLSLALVVLGSTRAEEYLIKGDKGEAKFLGWRVSDQQFTTCNKTRMEISGGKVISTRQKCGGELPPAIAELEGIVVEVEPDKMTLTVHLDQKTLEKLNSKQRAEHLQLNGSNAEFYVPRTVTPTIHVRGRIETVDFMQIKTGDKVIVKPAFSGRAESVVVESQSGSMEH